MKSFSILSQHFHRVLLGLICIVPAIVPQSALALGQEQYVQFTKAPGSFAVIDGSNTANVFADPNDWPGVIRAASDLASDISAISGKKPDVVSSVEVNQRIAIIIGTVGKSQLIDKLIAAGKIDVAA